MKRLRNNRGAVLELALSTLLLVFAMCTMMVDACLISRSNNIKAENDNRYLQQAKILGEEFFTTVSEQRPAFLYEAYTAEYPKLVVVKNVYTPGKTEATLTLGQKKTREGQTTEYVDHLLTVKIKVDFTDDGYTARIIKWAYSAFE